MLYWFGQLSFSFFVCYDATLQDLDLGPYLTRPDPTQAYFWPAVNKRPTQLWPGYFLTWPDVIFLIRRAKWLLWKMWGTHSRVKASTSWVDQCHQHGQKYSFANIAVKAISCGMPYKPATLVMENSYRLRCRPRCLKFYDNRQRKIGR